jgi:nitroreductase
VGHALAALRFSAALLGWRVSLVPGEAPTSDVLGVGRLYDARVEPEITELFAVVQTTTVPSPTGKTPSPETELRIPAGLAWQGVPNILSPVHGYAWPVIDEVDLATRPVGPLPPREDFSAFPSRTDLFHSANHDSDVNASRIILGRRSAVDMDGDHTMPADSFFRMLARLIPTQDNRSIPFDALPWTPRIHLGVFVHRVEGLTPGLYALVRDPRKVDDLKDAMAGEFAWTRAPGCPAGLDLFLLKEQDARDLAKAVSCGQDIAGDGVFSVGMFADYQASLRTFGPSFYRSLFWEAGMVGQVLYLEAEAAGFRATGIGCFFDDPVHAIFGLADRRWQSLYHLAVGHPVEDPRLRTLPGYATP